MIIDYFNPFSSSFRKASTDFNCLSTSSKIVAVVAAIAGGIFTPFLFFTGAFALFQFTVKRLNNGQDPVAEKVSQAAEEAGPFQMKESLPSGPSKRENFNGIGKLELPDGRIYVGAFENGKRCEPQENETFHFSNGDFLVGSSVNGELTGEGRFTDENGDVYEGQFQDGVFSGLGKVSYAAGLHYEGDFVDWKPCGIGVLTFREGSVLSGTFKGLAEASGILTLHNGTDIDVKIAEGRVQYLVR